MTASSAGILYGLQKYEVNMKFLITMNMPSNKGKQIHQMIVEKEGVKTLDQFLEALASNVFILVQEFYLERADLAPVAGAYKPHGRIIINTEYIGKVRDAEDKFS